MSDFTYNDPMSNVVLSRNKDGLKGSPFSIILIFSAKCYFVLGSLLFQVYFRKLLANEMTYFS